MSKPVEFIFDFALHQNFWPRGIKQSFGGPGGFVKKQSDEVRDMLKTLKSKDLQNIRPDAMWFLIPQKEDRCQN